MREGVGPANVDPAAETEDIRKERKKLQNRRNQRARRTRLREAKEDLSDRPFSVRRWRINQDNQDEEGSLPATVTKTSTQLELLLDQRKQLMKGSDHYCLIPETSPFSDLLLHLIHQNVFRGFSSNKAILYRMKSDCHRVIPSVQSNDSRSACPGLIITLPAGPDMPPSLFPTQMQMNIPHPGWIDIIPFPRMRDNLIKRHDTFDHWEFLGDMVGFLADGAVLSKRQGTTTVDHPDIFDEASEEIYSPLSGWKGAIVWGEPYLKESWEFRAPFLKKWAWVIEGCDEIIYLSNGWRTGRGESPIHLPQMIAAV